MDVPTPASAPRSSAEKADTLREQGNSLVEKGDLLPAVELYTQSLELCPTDARTLSNRSAAFLRLERFADALADAVSARRLRPGWPKPHLRAGQAHSALGEHEEALACFDAALGLEPANPFLKQLRSQARAKALYSSLCRCLPVEVQQLPCYGAGLVARSALLPGTEIFRDSPLLSVASLDSEHVASCGACLRSLVQPSGLPFPAQIPPALRQLWPTVAGVCCPHCGEQARYCDERCREQAWVAHHKVECLSAGLLRSFFAALRDFIAGWRSRPSSQAGVLPLLDALRVACRLIAMAVARHGLPLEKAASAARDEFW
eukprot:RCo012172